MIKNRTNLKSVDKIDHEFLYDLLKHRDPNVNISHKKMPSFKEHVKFVKSKPYSKWYIIKQNNEKVGSIYLSKQKKIKLFEPFVGKEEVEEASKVIKGKFWASGSGVGKVNEFENAFTKFVGCKDSVALNSGTAALHFALSALNVEKTEVIVPSITFVSTAHAAVYNNAKPRFVDVDESTLCIDIEDLEKKISQKTSVIIPVHMGGYPCDLEKIQKLAKDYKIKVVEDAAHACGANYQGKKIGSHSDMVCFSFHPVKNLSMPTGGLIALNSNLNTINSLKSKRWCGISNRKGTSYDIDSLGWNFFVVLFILKL